MCEFELPKSHCFDLRHLEPWLSLLKLNYHWQTHFTRRTSSHEYPAGRNGGGEEYPFDADRYCQARVSTICTFTRRSGDRPRICGAHGAIGVTVQLLLNFLDRRLSSSLPRPSLSPAAERALKGFKEQQVQTQSNLHQSSVGRHKTNGKRRLSVTGTSKNNKHRPVPLWSTSYFALPSKSEVPGNDVFHTSTIGNLRGGSVWPASWRSEGS
jgi:hypothetical protein